MTEPSSIRNLCHSNLISYPNYQTYRTIIHSKPTATISIRLVNYLNGRSFILSKPKPRQYKLGPKEPNREKLHIYESQTTTFQLVSLITSITQLLSIINLNHPDSIVNNSKVTYDIHSRAKPYQLKFSRTLSIIRNFMHHVSKPSHVNLCFKLYE